MTKILDRFKEPLTQGLSILTLLAFFGFHLLGKIIVETFEINDTMGWKWSVLHTWIDNIPTYSILIFFGIYVILNISKIKTNLKLSAIHLSLIALIAFFGFQLIGKIIVELFDINVTMGWKISVIHTWIDNIPMFSALIFFGIYLILNISKVKTNLILSAIHFSLIALSAFLYNFWELDLRITLLLIGFSFIILGTHLYQSLMSTKVVKE
jgi:hypothetical protein